MRHVIAGLGLGLGLIALAAFAAEAPPAAKVEYKIEMDPLGPLPTKAGATRSDDGRHVVFITKQNDKSVAVLDGQRGPAFDDISGLRFTGSPSHLVYAARTGETWTLVVDGKPGPAMAKVEPYSVDFGEDGKHTAYVGTQNGRSVVVVDGKAGPPFDGIGQQGACLTADGEPVYVATTDGKWCMVKGDKPGPLFDGILQGTSIPVLSPDRRHWAYVAKRGDQWLVVIDGKEGAGYGNVVPGTQIFSPDSKHSAYGALKGDKWVVVTDGHEGAPFDDVKDLAFEVGGSRVAFAAREGENWRLVVDDKPGKPYARITDIRLDGGRVAHAAYDGNGWMAVIDDQEGPRYEVVDDLAFLAGGKHSLYIGREGASDFVVFDGKPGPAMARNSVRLCVWNRDGSIVAYAGRKDVRWHVVANNRLSSPYEGIISICLSPDGQRVAYAAQDKKNWMVIVDDQSGPMDDRGGNPIFSADSRHVAHWAMIGTKWFVDIDGHEGPRFDDLVPNDANFPYAFRADGSLEYLAAKDGTLYRVRHVPVAGK
jgi:hypothetical protein